MAGSTQRPRTLWCLCLVWALVFSGCRSYVIGPASHGGDAPAVFDLGLKPELFAGRLPEAPDKASCHSQGLAIAGDRIVLSCCMFTSRATRAEGARSVLLSAPLEAVERGASDIPWLVVDITAPAPTLPEAQLGHPSGLFFDGEGVWVANAVYAPHSESLLQRYDPLTLEPMDALPIHVDDHIGTLGGFGSGYETLVGFNWDSEEAYRWRDAQPELPVPVNGGEYQDCAGDGDRLTCGYVRLGKARMDTLGPGLRVQSTQTLPRMNGAKHALTHEGLAASGDGRYLYFLPDDLPSGRLFRLPVSTPSEEPTRSAPRRRETASAPSAL